MIYALQATLTFPTATRRDNVVAALETRIAAKPRWGATTVAPSDEDGFRAVVEVRFVSQADLDDAYTFLQQRGGQQQGTGRITRHVCSHDDPNPASCGVDAEVTI